MIINPRPFMLPPVIFQALRLIYEMWSPENVALVSELEAESLVGPDNKKPNGKEKKFWESMFWDFSSSSSGREFTGEESGFTGYVISETSLFKETWTE